MKVAISLLFTIVFVYSSCSQDFEKMNKKELHENLDLLIDSIAVLNTEIDNIYLQYNSLELRHVNSLEEYRSLTSRCDELIDIQSMKDSIIEELESLRGSLEIQLIAASDSLVKLKHVLDSVSVINKSIIDTMLFVGSDYGDRGFYITFQSENYKLMNIYDSLVTLDSHDILSSVYDNDVFNELIIAAETNETDIFVGRKFKLEFVLEKKESWYGGPDWGYEIHMISPSLISAEPIE